MANDREEINQPAGDPDSDKVSGSAGAPPIGIRIFSFVIHHWDYLLFLIYVLVLMIVVLPGLKWDYDFGHDTGLLMSSIRIWAGQVPFRDFYPWYGLLYHYLLAVCAGLLGNDLYAVKFYIQVVNPVLCMALLVVILRQFELPALQRFFVLLVVPAFGLERIYYCGSLRSFLPVMAISLWNYGFRRRKGIIYGLILPSILVLFLFSPETGIYSLPAALIFIALTLYFSGKKQRTEIFRWSLYGLLLTAITLTGLYLGTEWFRNYLKFVSYMSQDFRWAWGMSIPGVDEIKVYPLYIFYYLSLAIYLIAAFGLGAAWIKRGIDPHEYLWAPALIVFGCMAWYSATMRTSAVHLKFAFLPAVIMVALLLPRSLRPFKLWKPAGIIIAIGFAVAGTEFFKSNLLPDFKGPKYKMLMGVRVSPAERKIYDSIQDFAKGHDKNQIAFPLKSFGYGFLGLVPESPYDSPAWPMYPGYENGYVQSFKELHKKYIIIDDRDISWIFQGEAIDPLMDWIDQNYMVLKSDRPVRILQKRKKPVEIQKVMAQNVDKPYLLAPDNQFKVTFRLPENTEATKTYIEFDAEFFYRYEFLRRFSMPIIDFKFDGKSWTFDRSESGRQRINIGPGIHPYRLYLLFPAKQLELMINFSGAFNFKPERVVITNMKFHKFTGENSPRTTPYKLEE
jgi:hypothetical protein